MKTNRTPIAFLTALALVMIALALSTSASAQGEQRFKVGDTVKVANGDQWFEGTVIEVRVNKNLMNRPPFYQYRVHQKTSNTVLDSKWFSDYGAGSKNNDIRPAGD